jgi:hypothetical protein
LKRRKRLGDELLPLIQYPALMADLGGIAADEQRLDAGHDLLRFLKHFRTSSSRSRIASRCSPIFFKASSPSAASITV